MKKTPTCTTLFKLEAEALILENNYTFQQACGALNVSETALKQHGNEQQGISSTGYQALTPEQCEIQALKKRVQCLEIEKDILKNLTRYWLLTKSSSRADYLLTR